MDYLRDAIPEAVLERAGLQIRLQKAETVIDEAWIINGDMYNTS